MGLCFLELLTGNNVYSFKTSLTVLFRKNFYYNICFSMFTLCLLCFSMFTYNICFSMFTLFFYVHLLYDELLTKTKKTFFKVIFEKKKSLFST
jgi:hypothetical protein